MHKGRGQHTENGLLAFPDCGCVFVFRPGSKSLKTSESQVIYSEGGRLLLFCGQRTNSKITGLRTTQVLFLSGYGDY
jgi:hypothetical protein